MIDTHGVLPRFFAPGASVPGEVIALSDAETQHLMRVLRLRAGAAIRVFDGYGHEFDAVVSQAVKSGVTVTLGAAVDAPAAETRVAITLAQSVLKGDKMDDVIRDAVMMGVAAIQPIVAARSEVSLASLTRGGRRARWQRIAVSSAKQCGRAVVPLVLDPQGFEGLVLATPQPRVGGPGLMLVEPSAAADAVALSDLDPRAPCEATLVVGPEGGWSPQEVALAAGTCRFVRLGSRTLRADAAAIVALAALLTIWREI